MSSSTLHNSPILILNSIPAYRAWRQTAFDEKKSVGFVPTMGALHDGHLSLVRRSLHENDLTVVSIFVNPAQFAPDEDLSAYPRTLPTDLEQLATQKVDAAGEIRTPSAVFVPSVQDMYPSGIHQDVSLQKGTFVQVQGYGHQMEGATRPHFFRGVSTVVTKLFNIVQPTNAYFGQKDIQQALLLRRMCRDLLFAHPDADHVYIVLTVRDPVDGLALSSRNVFLSVEERSVANTLYQALQAAESGWLAGGTKDACIHAAEALVAGAVKDAASRGINMKLDYIQMNDPDTFDILEAVAVYTTILLLNDVENKIEYWDAALSAARPTGDVAPINVVFPSHTAHDHAFTSLKTTYSTAHVTLSEIYEYASDLASESVRPFKALPVRSDADDTWCIDPRGILTLSVSKTLYERLGVVGQKLPFKGCPERYVVDVPLGRATTSVGAWDRVRETQGLGPWHVAYVGTAPPSSTVQDVTARVRHTTDVYVPRLGDLTRSDSTEMHQERLEALFEWVGMAYLGAQRLHANDRVDPYVAVYEPPAPASIGDVTHMCWKGLMDGAFVRSVIDTAVSILAKSGRDNESFIAITFQSNLLAPVSYIPESLTKTPPRVPSLEAEDTVCLVLSKLSDRLTWAMGQSIGKWDARWG